MKTHRPALASFIPSFIRVWCNLLCPGSIHSPISDDLQRSVWDLYSGDLISLMPRKQWDTFRLETPGRIQKRCPEFTNGNFSLRKATWANSWAKWIINCARETRGGGAKMCKTRKGIPITSRRCRCLHAVPRFSSKNLIYRCYYDSLQRQWIFMNYDTLRSEVANVI